MKRAKPIDVQNGVILYVSRAFRIRKQRSGRDRASLHSTLFQPSSSTRPEMGKSFGPTVFAGF